ncbi:unnamed protein product [Pocillopora meandrina]|uniref:Uromodulin-like n=1 Tax=Pocillopora meandrina TaxID=46732 RepID=A0AAU9XY02_9CNID|nr:unnamed protein product [Pocillopora meandrina]
MRFFISVTLCIAYEIFAQECKKDEHAIFGMMLRRHTFKKLKSSIAVECNRACNDDFRCHSFNYLITEKLCELNNRTKEARPENFVPNSERYYVRSNKKRGDLSPGRFKALLLAINYKSLFIDKFPLGSIPEFPAETCEEINASEDGKAKSGEYWIYSVITGKTALVSCDMEPEVVDLTLIIFTICTYLYLLSKKSYVYSMIRQTFKGQILSIITARPRNFSKQMCVFDDHYHFNRLPSIPKKKSVKSTHVYIDECASGVHNCHSSASCTNTVGSFKCSCNKPYRGDGKSCIPLPSECQNYQSLTGSDRKITYGNQNTVCDRGIHGWYRFEGAAGTRMPTSCPPKQRCNTHASGWLNGAHPTVADGQVTRTVCFHWGSNCCNWSRSVNVINCGDYYVYYITGTPACSLRYCSTD